VRSTGGGSGGGGAISAVANVGGAPAGAGAPPPRCRMAKQAAGGSVSWPWGAVTRPRPIERDRRAGDEGGLAGSGAMARRNQPSNQGGRPLGLGGGGWIEGVEGWERRGFRNARVYATRRRLHACCMWLPGAWGAYGWSSAPHEGSGEAMRRRRIAQGRHTSIGGCIRASPPLSKRAETPPLLRPHGCMLYICDLLILRDISSTGCVLDGWERRVRSTVETYNCAWEKGICGAMMLNYL